MSTRRFLALFLLMSLLVAGVASYYASTHPDGLSFVAEKTGFSDREQASPASESPLAGYSTEGIDDDRVSGGLAGVAGCLLVLALSGGLFWVVRRRGTGHEPADVAASQDAPRDSRAATEA
jgi:cobalt/nickel transport protein